MDIGSANVKYGVIIQAHDEASEKTVPKRKRVKKKKAPWENAAVITQREHLRVVAREKRKDPFPSNLDRFAKAVEDLNSAYEREQMQYVEGCAARIKAASDAKRASESWGICNEVTWRKKSNRAILKADSPTEQVGIWKDHFEKLLAPAPSPQAPCTNTNTPKIIVEAKLPIDTGDFTMAELGACLKGTPNNKATRLDEWMVYQQKSGSSVGCSKSSWRCVTVYSMVINLISGLIAALFLFLKSVILAILRAIVA